MRHWNKPLALLLAMAMALGMTVTAFAEEGAEDDSPAAAVSDTDQKDGDTTPADDDNKDGDTTPADDDNKDGDTTPADDDNKDGDTTPADDDNKDGDTTPADDDNKDGDTTPADGEDQKEGDAAPAAMNYSDVTEQNWFHGAVAFVTENKLMDGMTDTTFGPSEKMTRQMLAVALYRLAGSPEVTAENPFTDVADDAAYKDAVVWAYSVGVVTGITDTTFVPDSTVQRQAIAAMLARYIGADLSADSVDMSSFADADAIQNYAKGAMSWAVQNELLKGNPDGTVDPRGDATRSAVATILQRFAPLAEGKAPTAAGDDDTTAPADDADKKDDAAPDTNSNDETGKKDDTTPASDGNTDTKDDTASDGDGADSAEDNKES